MTHYEQVQAALPHLTMDEQLSVLCDIIGGATVKQSDDFSDALFDLSAMFDVEYDKLQAAASVRGR